MAFFHDADLSGLSMAVVIGVGRVDGGWHCPLAKKEVETSVTRRRVVFLFHFPSCDIDFPIIIAQLVASIALVFFAKSGLRLLVLAAVSWELVLSLCTGFVAFMSVSGQWL
ncbi:MAG: hypothetical protein MUC50_21850 [Myxococcota bacterium]|nr:hypothetical protein [Myxococcota bacterium]